MTTNVESHLHFPIDVAQPPPASGGKRDSQAFHQHLVDGREAPRAEETRPNPNADEPAVAEDSKHHSKDQPAQDRASPRDGEGLKASENSSAGENDSAPSTESGSAEESEHEYFLVDYGGIIPADEEQTDASNPDALDEDNKSRLPDGAIPIDPFDEEFHRKNTLGVERPIDGEGKVTAQSADANAEVKPLNPKPDLSPSNGIVPEPTAVNPNSTGDQSTPPTDAEATTLDLIPEESAGGETNTKVGDSGGAISSASDSRQEERASVDSADKNPTRKHANPTQPRSDFATGTSTTGEHPNPEDEFETTPQQLAATRKHSESFGLNAAKAEQRQIPSSRSKTFAPSALVPADAAEIDTANKQLQEDSANSAPDFLERIATTPKTSASAEQSTASGPTLTGSDTVTPVQEKPTEGQPRLPQLLTRSRDNASQQQQPLTDVQQARLVQRVAKAFDVARARGESTVRLRLSPPELGSLRLEVQVESGSLVAKLEVETQTTREVLLDNLNALRQRLAEQSIRVDQFDVDLLDRQSEDQWAKDDRRGSKDRSEDKATELTKERTGSTREVKPVHSDRLLEEGLIDVIV